MEKPVEVECVVVLPSGELANVLPDQLTVDQELDALREFAAKVRQMSPSGQRAAILWLADFFLDLRAWRR